jgi:tetratricopeptide (TPR) repeat protein/transcriptional regulator with XRE-family HTH domain
MRRGEGGVGRDGTVLHVSGPHERLVSQLAQIKQLSGVSLRALAGQAGLSSSSLSRYLTGRLVPPWEAVVALCRAVGRDPRPLRPLWAEATRAGAAPAPRRNDLPADLFDFTGREAERARIEELLRTAGAVVVDGMAGVGKTSLAVHVAHRLAGAYPDGGLYLDLHGFTPGQEPLEPPVALERLLGALDVAVPAGLEDRAGLWRSELSRRRVLVLLDNAADADRVRPLLPGAGRSAVLLTSRNRLVSLDAVPPVSLAPLDDDEAARLFGRAAGLDTGEPDAVGQVLRQCGGLPLALRMAGARLRHRPGWTVAVLAERLRDGANRFDAAFGMSLRQLDDDERRVFRLLGVMPGAGFDAAAAAALTGLPPGRCTDVLDELVDAHLVQETAPGRFRMHDLIRQYAADLAAEEEPDAATAVRRVVRHYLGAAAARVADEAWLDLEYTNLVAAFDAAVRLGEDEVVAGLPQTLRVWFFRRRGTADHVRLLEGAAEAAGRLGRDQQRASLLADLGFAHAAAGRLPQALAAYESAVATDDELAATLALRTGFARRDAGEPEPAQARFRQARELFEKTGNRAGQSQALAFDGLVTLALGRPTEAAALARAALELAEGPARITGLVALGLATSSPPELHEALRLAGEHRLPHQQAWCHSQLGVALRRAGDPAAALEHHRRALELLESLAETQLEIECRREYEETLSVA